MFKLAKNAVSKSPIVFKVFLEKILEFFLCHQIFDVKTTLLLMLLLNYCSVKKQSNKKDCIWSIGSSGFKIIFILLVETIAV